MNKKLAIIIGLAAAFSLSAAPKRFYVRQDQSQSQLIEGFQNAIEDLKHETANHEAEMRRFDEKFNNQEVAIDALWKQFNDANVAQREKLREGTQQLEAKLANLEIALLASNGEIENLKKHLNESANTVSHYKQRVATLEKVIEVQNQNLEHVETAMNALLDAFQIKDIALHTEDPFHALAKGLVYQVKAGDSLEKIARKHNTSVAKIKELNRLTEQNDLIVVGQKLKLPES